MGHTVANISMPTGSIADLAHTFPFGIEEEYFLVDAKTKAIALMVPEALFAIAKAAKTERSVSFICPGNGRPRRADNRQGRQAGRSSYRPREQ